MTIQDVVLNLLLGVIGNGFTSVIAYVGRAAHRGKKGDKLPELYARNSTAGLLLQRGLTRSAAMVSLLNRDKEGIQRFLNSPDAETIVRQIYAAQIIPRQTSLSENVLKELERSLYLYLQPGDLDLSETARQLLGLISATCEQVLKEAIDYGVLAAHEATSTARFRVLRDELAALKLLVEHLTTGEADVTAISRFEVDYRKQIVARHKTLTPPNLYGARRLPIDAIYVLPTFSRLPTKRRPEPESLTHSNLLATLHRTVILGTPGAGKSTFAQKVAFDLAKLYQNRYVGNRQLSPSLVILRDYGALRKDGTISVRQFLENISTSDYQLAPETGTFEYLLRNGRLLVIFDGLDELLDTAYRQKITRDIETFCALYPNIPVLVTSREVGYDQAPLDPEVFDIVKIAPFDKEQIREYVEKWFNADQDLSDPERHRMKSAFLRESAAVPDLCANPLMLALLCNIYRGENYIPKNRPDVYEKCALMLFEKWDKARNICVPLPFEAHISPTIKYLAHWIYTDEALQAGVTEDALIKKATEYLFERRFDNIDEATQAARQFIDVCRGRAWVFTDTGTTKAGERIYQFTHRTFLEHFTAGHLVRTQATPEELEKVLLPRLARQEWDVVAQLAVQMQNKNVEGAAEQFLESLLARCKEHERERYPLISFAVRSLQFLVPRPEVVKHLAHSAISYYLDPRSVPTRELIDDPDKELLVDLFRLVAEENRDALGNMASIELIRAINTADQKTAILALEIARHSLAPIWRFRALDLDTPNFPSFWWQVRSDILEKTASRRTQLAAASFRTAFDEFLEGAISANDFIKWQGVDKIWLHCGFDLWRGRVMWPIATTLIAQVLVEDEGEWSTTNPSPRRALAELAAVLPEIPPPWLSSIHTTNLLSFRDVAGILPIREKRTDFELAPKELAGAALLLAPSVEALSVHARDNRNSTYFLTEVLAGRLAELAPIFTGYFKHTEVQHLAVKLRKSALPDSVRQLLTRWLNREVAFLEPTMHKRSALRKAT
jgi:hypothetical protein